MELGAEIGKKWLKLATVKNCLFHDIVEIKCDSDVMQMIQRWKDVQRISKHVIRPRTFTDIELFILLI